MDYGEAVRLFEEIVRRESVLNDFPYIQKSLLLLDNLESYETFASLHKPSDEVLIDGVSPEDFPDMIAQSIDQIKTLSSSTWCENFQDAFQNKPFTNCILKAIKKGQGLFLQGDPFNIKSAPNDHPLHAPVAAAYQQMTGHLDDPRWASLALYSATRLIMSIAEDALESQAEEDEDKNEFWFDMEQTLLFGNGEEFAERFQHLLQANPDYGFADIIGEQFIPCLIEMVAVAGDTNFFPVKVPPSLIVDLSVFSEAHQRGTEERGDQGAGEDGEYKDHPLPPPSKYHLTLIDHYMANITKRYPDAWKIVDHLRARRGDSDVPDYPDWCFCPQGFAQAAAGQTQDTMHLTFNPRLCFDIQAIACFSAWRTTKGVYSFDADIYDAVIDTEMSGQIPQDLLYRMPEWSIYIPIPEERSLSYMGEKSILGFFAWLDVSLLNEEPEKYPPRLCFLILVEGLDHPIFSGLNLVGGTIDDATESYREESIKENIDNFPGVNVEDIRNRLTEMEPHLNYQTFVRAATSLVLYICASNSDITLNGMPKRPSGKPRIKKTKKGPRYFPAQKPVIWEAGYRIGAALRKAKQQAPPPASGPSDGKHKKSAHTRKAHWHSYLTGKGSKKDPTKGVRILKWIPPTVIGIGNLDDLIPTVRPVD